MPTCSNKVGTLHDIVQDLGQLDPFKLVHGHLGDPLGRSGNLLGPELDSRAIQEVFHDHDGEMLIVQPDTGGGSQRYSQSIADLDTGNHNPLPHGREYGA